MPGFSYDDAGTHRGTCEECGATGEATVTVMNPPGVAAWSCPSCGSTQEPPAVTEGR